ncbi:NTP transferase domain-containing protein [Streptomyces sp. NPDC005485]|uniref:NTP transferase domain-containing protein n=1 Tax=Streptomyces sp. NPDC005485 TaxID=3155591 RepID=UPI0033B0061A
MNAYEPPGAADYDAVVLAGGAARRLGGADKPGVRVGGRPLLDRVLAACSGAAVTVVVAEPRPTARSVTWAREDPPGGGPLAALAAGLRHTSAQYVVVLSADLPFLAGTTVRRLVAGLRADASGEGLSGPGSRPNDSAVAVQGSGPPRPRTAALETGPEGAPVGPDGESPRPDAKPSPPTRNSPDPEGAALTRPDGVMLTDPDGRDQPLVAAYRVASLRRELAVLVAEYGGLDGLPLRRLTGALDLTRISDPVASFDCDTWDDIAVARARIREHGHVLDEWISAVKDELGIDLDVDTGVLLDLARDAAHGVARPAAPLTTFLVGYAAAQARGGPEAVAEAARKAAALALRWADEDAPDAKPGSVSDAEPGPVTETEPGTEAGTGPGDRPGAG